MMSMYREELLDHYKYPRNFGKLECATMMHREFNPLCGDDITLQVVVNNGVIQDIKFNGHGCAISMAAASMLSEHIKGKQVKEIPMNKEFILDLLKVPISPGRIKCATLALGALRTCLGGTSC